MNKRDISNMLKGFLNKERSYELDDFLQEKDLEWMPLRERILAIHLAHATVQYPIGLSNPRANQDILSLISELESGLP